MADRNGLSLVSSANPSQLEASLVASELIRLFELATNNDERAKVMELWHVTQPAGEASLRRLVVSIYLPALKLGKGATKIALDQFGLVERAPVELRRRIARAIRRAVKGDSAQKRKADNVLSQW